MAHVTFWFEFASTYSYLSAMRIEEMARKADVDLIWKPFLLGPIFKAQNWDTSPFNLYPAKGRYMVRDIERIAQARGLVFRLPSLSLRMDCLRRVLRSRVLRRGGDPTSSGPFSAWSLRSNRTLLSDRHSRRRLRLPVLPKTKPSSEPSRRKSRAKLRSNTEEAQAQGIFGAPSFTTENGELFWGDDRLEDALLWSTGEIESLLLQFGQKSVLGIASILEMGSTGSFRRHRSMRILLSAAVAASLGSRIAVRARSDRPGANARQSRKPARPSKMRLLAKRRVALGQLQQTRARRANARRLRSRKQRSLLDGRRKGGHHALYAPGKTPGESARRRDLGHEW